VSRVVLNSFNSSRLKFSRQSAVVFPNKLADTDIGDINGWRRRKEYNSVWVSSVFKVACEFLRSIIARKKVP